MTLTSQQLDRLVEKYAERCVDDMDTKCLMQFVYDAICENMCHMSEHDVLEQLSYVYDEETVEQMIAEVTVQ